MWTGPRAPAWSVVLLLSVTGCLDTTLDVSYSSMGDAVADGAVDRGWIPEWIPANARNLREVHDLDNNLSALAFEIPPRTHWPLPDGCITVRFAQTPPNHFSRDWWPSRKELEREYAFFECRRDPVRHVFVGRRLDGRGGLHWRSASRGP